MEHAQFTPLVIHYVLLVIAGLSDGLDGWLAKTFDWRTRLGGLLDPAADKLLLVSLFFALTYAGLTPVALTAVVIGRDVVIVLGAIAYQLLIAPVTGTVRATTQWNRLTDGTYISHAYVVTPTLHICPGASATPPASTPALTPAEFIAAAVPGAQAGWRQYGVPASTTIAQAILESGWGRSGLAVNHRNYFGIKCQSGRYGALANGCYTYRTQECTKAGKCFTTTGSFRTYATMAHSFRDHGNFLKVNSRYKPAFGYTRNANKFIWNVWKAGYATDPNYYTKVTGIMTKNKLYQYDTWK